MTNTEYSEDTITYRNVSTGIPKSLYKWLATASATPFAALSTARQQMGQSNIFTKLVQTLYAAWTSLCTTCTWLPRFSQDTNMEKFDLDTVNSSLENIQVVSKFIE